MFFRSSGLLGHDHSLLTQFQGTRSSICRQKAKEEVVQGKGSVNTLTISPKTSLRRLPLSTNTYSPDIFFLRTVKDKANHAVVLDKPTTDKLYKDVQSYRLITVATLVDRLKINGSLAREALRDLEKKGQIKKVVGHSKLSIYSMFGVCLVMV